MTAYYNEVDPFAAQWLRNLIARGLIAPGDVDERSVVDVRADDLVGYTQCHFFAGLGGWSYALRRAGWEDVRPVWTGSCPCQPFSAAGKQQGTDDARHLWPHWFRLIREHRPVAIFGEQVAAAIRHGWLDLVCSDLEGAGYAVGSAVLGAHSVGAPHIRQRLYFVAQSDEGKRRRIADGQGRQPDRTQAGRKQGDGQSESRSDAGKLADADGRNPGAEGLQRGREHRQQPQDGGAGGGLGRHRRREITRTQATCRTHDTQRREGSQRHHPTAGFWADAEWLPCIDGKARPTKPGLFPLAYGVAGRVGKLRAAGNAICAPAAEEFIRAYLGVTPQIAEAA